MKYRIFIGSHTNYRINRKHTRARMPAIADLHVPSSPEFHKKQHTGFRRLKFIESALKSSRQAHGTKSCCDVIIYP